MIDFNKIVYGIMVAAMVAVVISYAVLSARIHARDTKIMVLEARLSECASEIKSADAAIERQNAAVEAVKIDTVVIERQTREVVKKYDVKREIVAERISKDTSCENEISIIGELLHGFSVIGLRAKGNDKD